MAHNFLQSGQIYPRYYFARTKFMVLLIQSHLKTTRYKFFGPFLFDFHNR